jgi:hypothetical protein
MMAFSDINVFSVVFLVLSSILFVFFLFFAVELFFHKFKNDTGLILIITRMS